MKEVIIIDEKQFTILRETIREGLADIAEAVASLKEGVAVFQKKNKQP